MGTLTYLGYGGHHLQAAELDWRRKWLTARHRVARTEPGHVGTADDQIADCQKDNRTFRIAKARGVDQEGEHLQGRRRKKKGERVLNTRL